MEKYYKCPDCKTEFSEEESHYFKEYGKYVMQCPKCDNWELDEGYKCTECEQWFMTPKVDDVELCEECYTEALKRLQDDYKIFIDKYDETDTAILEDYLASKYY